MLKSLQVCGTSGSGKTTLVRRLLDETNITSVRPTPNVKKHKPLMYFGLWDELPVAIMGSYESTCGGCDTIPSVKIVAGLLEEYQHSQFVLVFEGLMISHMIGTVGAMQMQLGLNNHWRAYLDTSLEQCLANVQARRDARGITKPFNPENTTKDWPRVRQSKANWEAQGCIAHDIRYDHAWDDFVDLLTNLGAGHE